MNRLCTYKTLEGIELKAELIPTQQPTTKPTLIYIHGGGFILGERNDLPTEYITMLNNAGYPLLLLDYPLAPEVDLATIHQCLSEALTWFHKHFQTEFNLTSADYILLGISAGA